MPDRLRHPGDVVALDFDGTRAGVEHRVSAYATGVLHRLGESGVPTIVWPWRSEATADVREFRPQL
ncbi:hypothetical protein [Pseudonocardia acidicola]|uniref:Uncharacterized protein n=1 Tax=Pseudonocardia acidicola TaxID=2724939 RepID=A0ABX1SIG5_9PSEU|nr:hypothetical protein [Pseudonocardia acidicola]NMI01377.1 hypothetical protein [Pseudonocardia acidicola]